MRISRREDFSFALARKLLAHYEATPLHMDMRAVLGRDLAESLEGDISIEPDWLSEHVGVLPEDRVRIDPEVWAQVAGHIERREAMRADYQIGEVRPEDLPVFLKPEVANGSRGTHTARTIEDIEFYCKKDPTLLLLEYLPGKEYTIDCFTAKDDQLRFCEGRQRTRT